MTDLFPQDDRLRALARRAADQVPASLRVTFDDVHREARARARVRGTSWVVALAAALALGWMGGSLLGSVGAGEGTVEAPVVARAPSLPPRAPEVRTAPSSMAPERAEPRRAIASAALAPAVSVQPVDRARPPVVIEAWSVALSAGRYEIAVAASAPRSLAVYTVSRRYELEPGTTTTLEVDRLGGIRPGVDARGRGSLSASELSSRAEAAMARGDRSAALGYLRRLASGYPRSPQARAGLLDLARLEAARGRDDRAHCAYVVFLRRWPEASVREEVGRAMAKLEAPAGCRGLDPR